MITNFEDITTELTADEMHFLPNMIAGFKLRTIDNPITGKEICKSIKENTGIKFTEARLRKFVNHIRSNSLLPLIATSKGYYCSFDVNEIKAQIKSLDERANAIHQAKKGLLKFLSV